ncbi:3'-5' exonuclease [Hymenobacter coalescens]
MDTETTGLPARWQRPYAEEWEWPSIAQLAWQVYTFDGQLVTSDAAYLRVPRARMTAASVAVHGLTVEFLDEHGEAPAAVLQRLLADLEAYQPRVIGHFLRLDFHVLGAALHRAALPNPLPVLPQFCTMQVSHDARLHGRPRQLRLFELHELLFGERLVRLHDAAIDAAATARCFFELRQRGLITDSGLDAQPRLSVPGGPARGRRRGWLWLVAAGGLLLLFLFYWLVNG